MNNEINCQPQLVSWICSLSTVTDPWHAGWVVGLVDSQSIGRSSVWINFVLMICKLWPHFLVFFLPPGEQHQKHKKKHMTADRRGDEGWENLCDFSVSCFFFCLGNSWKEGRKFRKKQLNLTSGLARVSWTIYLESTLQGVKESPTKNTLFGSPVHWVISEVPMWAMQKRAPGCLKGI